MTTYPDPFAETSPWDNPAVEAPAQPAQAPASAPQASAPGPASPEAVTLSFKGGAGYDASLLVLRAPSITDMATLLAAESATLKALLERAAKVQAFNTGLNSAGRSGPAPKRFENGKVVQAPETAAETPTVAGDDCPHGRSLVEKPTWTALFCNSNDDNDKCAPLWRQKDGSFRAK